ncbi:hypothetical protein JMJ77_0009086, partial [Colletotrichum scovillei]
MPKALTLPSLHIRLSNSLLQLNHLLNRLLNGRGLVQA